MRSIFGTLLLSALILNGFGAEGKPLKLEEVLSVIRSNMVDMSEVELSNTAAEGLVKELGTKVQWLTEGVTNETAAAQFPDSISKTAVYEQSYGYIRVKSVDERLTNEFRRRLTQLLASNKLAGIIVDLRYAGGTNYEAAAIVADEFAGVGEPLLKLGEKQLTATAQSPEIRLPIAVLLNRETKAAAEALAGVLREVAAALLIGKTTAGEARLYETFTLSTGQKLRVGKWPVQVGRGKSIPATGIIPDIQVNVSSEEEAGFYQDPYRERTWFVDSGKTNEIPSFIQNRPRNEAELVRRHRNDEREIEDIARGPRASVEVAVITDPTLARALDFLKGISIWQPRR